jgi:hypothetical protein
MAVLQYQKHIPYPGTARTARVSYFRMAPVLMADYEEGVIAWH